MTIGKACNNRIGSVVHELAHIVGFLHEQARPDRDRYIRIHFHNILPGKKENFEKMDALNVDSRGVAYDYGSIMHYPTNAFARHPWLKTIELLDKTDADVGQRERLSPLDILQTKLMYNCPFPGNLWWSDFFAIAARYCFATSIQPG